MRTDVYGVGFDDLAIDEAVERAFALLDSVRPVWAVTPNPEIVWMCRDNAGLKRVLNDAALVLPDGIGVVYGAKILGRPLKGKVAGIDFAEKLIEKMSKSGKSLYLFGAKPGVAEKAAENLAAKYPGLIIAGTSDGYFKDDDPVIEKINATSPHFLMVCLGAPKQELWMAQHAGRLRCGLMAGLGGSLDVFAGTAERAPESWQRLHLEWLFRLKKEPRRFWRMMSLPKFIFAVTWDRLRGR